MTGRFGTLASSAVSAPATATPPAPTTPTISDLMASGQIKHPRDIDFSTLTLPNAHRGVNTRRKHQLQQ